MRTEFFYCDCTESGEECLRIMEKSVRESKRYDIILMDEELSVNTSGGKERKTLQGHDTVKLLRKAGHTLPIIMFTTKNNFDFLRVYATSGADAFMLKGKFGSNFANSIHKAITVLSKYSKKNVKGFRGCSSPLRFLCYSTPCPVRWLKGKTDSNKLFSPKSIRREVREKIPMLPTSKSLLEINKCRSPFLLSLRRELTGLALSK